MDAVYQPGRGDPSDDDRATLERFSTLVDRRLMGELTEAEARELKRIEDALDSLDETFFAPLKRALLAELARAPASASPAR